MGMLKRGRDLGDEVASENVVRKKRTARYVESSDDCYEVERSAKMTDSVPNSGMIDMPLINGKLTVFCV
jgi:hypothetical protein